jgi:hypothetical protein
MYEISAMEWFTLLGRKITAEVQQLLADITFSLFRKNSRPRKLVERHPQNRL